MIVSPAHSWPLFLNRWVANILDLSLVGQIYLDNSEKPVPFPRIEVFLMQKNLSVLFSGRRK